MNLGGGGRDRTDDLLLAKQTLSQLSYTPKIASIRAHLYRDFEILPLSNGLILRILIICNMLSIIKFSLPLVVDIRLLFLVPQIGLEPIHLSAGDFESPVSTNFTTKAFS